MALAHAVTFSGAFSPYQSSSCGPVNAYSFLKSYLKMSPPRMSLLTIPSKFRPLSLCL